MSRRPRQYVVTHGGTRMREVLPRAVTRAQSQNSARLAQAEDEVARRAELATADGTLVLSEAGPYASAAVGRRPVDWPDGGVPLLRDGQWLT